MKSQSSIFLIAFFVFTVTSQVSFSQIGTISTKTFVSSEAAFGRSIGLGSDYQFRQRNIVRLEGAFNKDQGSFTNYNYWNINAGHVYAMGLSKKFPEAVTWYTGQTFKYQNFIGISNDEKFYQTHNFAFEISVGRQFNVSKNLSIFTEMGVIQSLFNRRVNSNYIPFDPNNYTYGQIITPRVDEVLGNRYNGLYFKTGLIYRFPVK